MERDPGWNRLIDGLRHGDETIVTEFCERYGGLLQQLADKHIADGLRRRVGPESVVQSACRTFLRRAREGQFQLDDSADLWRLLCAITLTKVREQARFHRRARRSIEREIAGDGETRPEAPAPGPQPDDAVAIAEEFEVLMASLTEEERQMVELKLQDCTRSQIADRLGCSERTVRRILARVRDRLQSDLTDGA